LATEWSQEDEAVGRSTGSWRSGRKYAVALVVAGSVSLFWAESIVSASSAEPAVISSLPLSGFVPVPASTGAVTAANESAVFRYSTEGGLEQFLVNGQAHAYMRSWYHPGPGGASVDIVAMSFSDSSYPARVMAGYEVLYKKRFNVPGIPSALGFSQPAAGSGSSTPVSNVMFSKGSTLYVVVIGGQSGTTNAIKMAKAQFNGVVPHPHRRS
jgi:hypothetical protein